MQFNHIAFQRLWDYGITDTGQFCCRIVLRKSLCLAHIIFVEIFRIGYYFRQGKVRLHFWKYLINDLIQGAQI